MVVIKGRKVSSINKIVYKYITQKVTKSKPIRKRRIRRKGSKIAKVANQTSEQGVKLDSKKRSNKYNIKDSKKSSRNGSKKGCKESSIKESGNSSRNGSKGL